MARALCWTALWDSARDAVTPASLLRGRRRSASAPRRPGIGVLLNVLGNASTAVERYVPAAERDAVRRGFLSTAADELQAAAPGSDQQLAWARTLAATSRYDASRLDLLRGILDGSTVIDGLAVDAELRWNLWHALAANGQATAGAAGRGAGPGQHGRRQVRARHGPRRPPRGGRQGGSLGGGGARHGAVQPAAERHHRRVQHRRGARCWPGFIDPYFECLEQVWAGRSIEIASRIVRGLYPAGQDLAATAEPPDATP